MNRRERRAAAKKPRAVRCRFCGRAVVLDDATCTIKHENPQCAEFVEGMARCGMEARVDPWVEMVRPDGSVVEKAKA
jgi:hypothetical protein